MPIFIDIIGKKFGKLIAIERISDGPLGKWKFKCECGNEKIISKQNVTQGKVKSCGCVIKSKPANNRLNLTGKKFNRLTVLNLNTCKNKRSTYWNCLCDCGKNIVVKGAYLTNNHTKSCGCLKVFKHENGDVGFRLLYYRYKNRAKFYYNNEFELTKEEFKKLTQQNCFYCGSEPKSISKSKSENSEYVYNGLDRVDTKRGYLLDNVVPCCGMCNRMKLDHSSEEFTKQILKICKHLKLGE